MDSFDQEVANMFYSVQQMTKKGSATDINQQGAPPQYLAPQSLTKIGSAYGNPSNQRQLYEQVKFSRQDSRSGLDANRTPVLGGGPSSEAKSLQNYHHAHQSSSEQIRYLQAQMLDSTETHRRMQNQIRPQSGAKRTSERYNSSKERLNTYEQ